MTVELLLPAGLADGPQQAAHTVAYNNHVRADNEIAARCTLYSEIRNHGN